MALDPKLKTALQSQDLAAVQERWGQMSERQRPSAREVSELLWTSAPVISPEIAQWMVTEGADPRYAQHSGELGMIGVAARALTRNQANLPLIEWLVEQGYQDLHRPVIPGGPTLLAEALFHPKGARLDVAEWLFQSGAVLDQQDRYGQTLLAKAAEMFRLDALVWLVEKGANPLIENQREELAEQHVPEDGQRIRAPYNAEEVYQFLVAYTQAWRRGEGQNFPIPEGVLEQRAVERIGDTYKNVPQEEWTVDHHRALKRIDGTVTQGPSRDAQHQAPGF